jgi:hypothetical protein
METVSRARVIDAPEATVREAITDVESFMRTAGFDEVQQDGETLILATAHGLLKVKLTVRLLDDPDAVLAYEQVEGIFEEMTTTYTVEAGDSGVNVEATTRFEIDATLDGSMLDAATVSTQRGRELEAQLDALESLE